MAASYGGEALVQQEWESWLDLNGAKQRENLEEHLLEAANKKN